MKFRGLPPCLPGMRPAPARPRSSRLVTPQAPSPRRRHRGRRHSGGSPRGKPAEQARGGGQVLGDRGDDLRDGAGVGGEDLGPQRAVARRDPGHVPQPLARELERVGGDAGRREPGGHRDGDEVRRVRDERDPPVMRFRVGDDRVGAAGDGECRHRVHRVGRCLRQRAQRPRAAQEQVRLRGGGPVPLPARQRVPGNVGLQVAAELAGLPGRQDLDARDVGVDVRDGAVLRVGKLPARRRPAASRAPRCPRCPWRRAGRAPPCPPPGRRRAWRSPGRRR